MQQPDSGVTDHYPMHVIMTKQQKQVGRWLSDSWLCDVFPDHQNLTNPDCNQTAITLRLHRDERAAYRMNLSSQNPRIFVICEIDEDDNGDSIIQPTLISASQDLASYYMDGGEEDVFSVPMPYAVQCWIEKFMNLHGEDTSNSGKRRFRDKSAGKKNPDKSIKQKGTTN